MKPVPLVRVRERDHDHHANDHEQILLGLKVYCSFGLNLVNGSLRTLKWAIGHYITIIQNLPFVCEQKSNPRAKSSTNDSIRFLLLIHLDCVCQAFLNAFEINFARGFILFILPI